MLNRNLHMTGSWCTSPFSCGCNFFFLVILGLVARNCAKKRGTLYWYLVSAIERNRWAWGGENEIWGHAFTVHMMSAKICPTHLCKPTVILMLNLCGGAVLHPLTWVIRVKNVVAMSRASTENLMALDPGVDWAVYWGFGSCRKQIVVGLIVWCQLFVIFVIFVICMLYRISVYPTIFQYN